MFDLEQFFETGLKQFFPVLVSVSNQILRNYKQNLKKPISVRFAKTVSK